LEAAARFFLEVQASRTCRFRDTPRVTFAGCPRGKKPRSKIPRRLSGVAQCAMI
jgi:hypothetical protein